MAFSAGTEVLNTDSESLFKGKHNTLAEVVGDKSLLSTLVTTSIVDSINSLQDQINDVVVGQFALPNDVYFTGGANGGGQINILKVNTANKIAFGTPVVAIDIQGGTISALSSPVPLSAGGTGATTQVGAQTALGLLIDTNVQRWDVNLDQIAALSPAANNFIVGDGSAWILRTPQQARIAAQVIIGGTDPGTATVQAWNARLDQIAAMNPASNPTTDSFIVGVPGGTWTMKDRNGTQTSLGLVINTNVQAWSSKLDQIAAISPATNGSFIVWNSGTTSWIVNTPSQARTSLQLGTLAQANTVDNTVWSGTVLSIANGGTGANNATSARANLLLGTIATQNSNAVSITGGGISATSIQMNNNSFITWLNASSVAKNIIGLNASNNLVLNGDGSQVLLQVAATTRFIVDASSFFPNVNDSYKIGGPSNRLDIGYFRTIQLCNDISNSSSDMTIGPIAGNNLFFRTGSTNRYAVDGNGHLVPVLNLNYDIGGASNRVRIGYIQSLRTVQDIDTNGAGGMSIGPSGGSDLNFRWSSATRMIGSNNDLYPALAGALNLGTTSNYINGINALVVQAPGNNHLFLQCEGGGEVRIRNNNQHWWTFGNFGIFTPTTAGTLDIGIDNTNQVNNIYADAYLTFTGCHRYDEVDGAEVGDPVYVEHKAGKRILKKCSKAKDSRVAGIYKGAEIVKDITGEVRRTIHIMAALGDTESGTLRGFKVSNKGGIPKNGSLLMVGPGGDLVLQEGTQIHSYTVGKCLQDLSESDFNEDGMADKVYGVIYAG